MSNKRESDNNLRVTTHVTAAEAEPYKKIKDNYWLVYYYLLSKSHYNNEEKDNPHRYVYRDKISPTVAARDLGISRSTVYRALDALSSSKLIKTAPAYYIIPRHESWASIEKNLLNALIGYCQVLGVDLLRTYLFVVAFDYKFGKTKAFSKRNVVRCLGHNENDTEAYKRLETYFDLLEVWKLVYLDKETKVDKFGTHSLYYIVTVNSKSEILEERLNERTDANNPYGLTKEEEKELEKYI